MEQYGINTRAIWAGSDPEQWQDWDVMPPISATSIYKQVAPGQFKRFDYSRLGNPTRKALEDAIAELDNAEFGFVFTSGSAAIVAAVHLLSAGDHIVSADDLYTGTSIYLTQIAKRMNIETTFVDATDATNIIDALKPTTKMIWLESISNPKLKVVDISDIVQRVKAINPDIIIAVDNTFLTPVILRPLDLGADLSIISCSKYVNGHHDVIMGSLTSNRKDLFNQLFLLQKTLGAVPTPMDCYQVIRSLKTLPLRMERHEVNGLAVAKFLESHPQVAYVLHPLLPSHPQHERAVAQQERKHSGMVACLLKGTPDNVRIFLLSIKVCLLATSLGGTCTTIAAPGSMVGDPLVKFNPVDPNFLRISVGLENVEDIIQDMRQALKKAYETKKKDVFMPSQ